MMLFNTTEGVVLERRGTYVAVPGEWDELFNRPDLEAHLRAVARRARRAEPTSRLPGRVLPPIGKQEVWAAGVTYNRSRVARMSESEGAGGSDLYDRVYRADRPELFFKATAHRVVGHGGTMHRRRDSSWIVPEPELALAVNRHGAIVGYTIGNDLSCRDIEGENPLYLTQAKVFSACTALGPGLLVRRRPLAADTPVTMEIRRRGRRAFAGVTRLSEMRKPLRTLVEYLFRDNAFPAGCLLLTGTGIVPPGRFSLERSDEVRITIPPVGTLVNRLD